ncbi:hypothetical protein RND81_14G168600 [Saponaria officinalis]|uniref:Uncharacterized protein n=1 Tax=Saponaria officinalis TaxID=3572 RepID=A0AAW1GN15_SAPOF
MLLPFIQTVLEQPLFTTDLISKLIKELEVKIDELFPSSVGAVEHNNKSTENEPTLVGEGREIQLQHC